MRPVVDLLKDSWGLFTKVWLKYLWLYLITIAGAMAILFAAIGTAVGQIFFDNAAGKNLTPDVFIKAWPIYLVTFVVLVLFSSLVGLAINKVVYSEGEGKTVSLKEAFSYSWQHFLQYFLVTLVTSLVVIVGLILLVIPGIYAAIVLSLVPVVFVLEENYSLNALSRSRELVKGNFWPVFGRFLVLGLIAFLISAVTNRAPLLSFVLNFVFSLISLAYIYLVYKDLAGIKK